MTSSLITLTVRKLLPQQSCGSSVSDCDKVLLHLGLSLSFGTDGSIKWIKGPGKNPAQQKLGQEEKEPFNTYTWLGMVREHRCRTKQSSYTSLSPCLTAYHSYQMCILPCIQRDPEQPIKREIRSTPPGSHPGGRVCGANTKGLQYHCGGHEVCLPIAELAHEPGHMCRAGAAL